MTATEFFISWCEDNYEDVGVCLFDEDEMSKFAEAYLQHKVDAVSEMHDKDKHHFNHQYNKGVTDVLIKLQKK